MVEDSLVTSVNKNLFCWLKLKIYGLLNLILCPTWQLECIFLQYLLLKLNSHFFRGSFHQPTSRGKWVGEIGHFSECLRVEFCNNLWTLLMGEALWTLWMGAAQSRSWRMWIQSHGCVCASRQTLQTRKREEDLQVKILKGAYLVNQ